MSTTIIAGGEPDYQGGLLTAAEYALSEAGAISGRASVRNALVRNGYPDGLCFWREYQALQPAPVEPPVPSEPDTARPTDIGRSLLTLALTAAVVWVGVGLVTVMVSAL